MTTQSPIQSLIEKFVGQKVEVTKQVVNYKSKVSGKRHRFTNIQVVPNDQTIKALESAVPGYELRILPPNTFGTMDLRSNRLTVYLKPVGGRKKGYKIAGLDIG